MTAHQLTRAINRELMQWMQIKKTVQMSLYSEGGSLHLEAIDGTKYRILVDREEEKEK